MFFLGGVVQAGRLAVVVEGYPVFVVIYGKSSAGLSNVGLVTVWTG